MYIIHSNTRQEHVLALDWVNYIPYPGTVHNIKDIQSGGHNQKIAKFQYAQLICNVNAASLKISSLAWVKL